jgi:wyosine [tRNA(Phe)-imidazoG37] synthetase (radical SAM superfamily)
VYCQVPGLERGSAPPIELSLLRDELRRFIGELTEGDFMRQRIPEGARRLAGIAISGNGEPTSARELPDVVEEIGKVLTELGLAGSVTPRLITNGSLVGRAHVRRGLERLNRIGGEVWFKLDAGSKAGFSRINDVRLSPERAARNLRTCAGLCPTWVQTCVFRLDDSLSIGQELPAYLSLLENTPPTALRGVLLYGLARPSCQPEAARLSPLLAEEVEPIAREIKSLGLTVLVSP